MYFNQYLKTCRQSSKLTQEQLVHALYSFDIDNFEGLDTAALSKWEGGNTRPTISRQIAIMQYFQELTGTKLPCWEGYSDSEIEDLICNVGMKNLLGKNKQFVSSFPSQNMNVNNMKIHLLRTINNMDTLLEINMDLHQASNHPSTQISLDQFKEWSLHPSSFFIACEYKGIFVGLFFNIKLKQQVFNDMLDFKIKKSDITVNDFALPDEVGCTSILSFYALNAKVATMLFVRYYAYLISNQNVINEIGGVTMQDEAAKIVKNMNLDYSGSMITEDGVKIRSYRQTLSNVFASENVVKMLFMKQECPEA